MKKIQVVDLARSVSILLVLAGHLQVLFVNKGSKFYFLDYLWYRLWLNHGFGVSVFFVVSGFLITRLIVSQGPGLFNPDLRTFYSRRAGRIFPLLFLVCLIGMAFNLLISAGSPSYEHCFGDPQSIRSFPFWVSIATFSLNWYKINGFRQPIGLGLHWDVLWSLSIEEQFYFFYPLLLKKLGNERNLFIFLALMIFLGPLSILGGWEISPRNGLVFYNSFAAFNLIAMGCLLYLVSERYKGLLSSQPKKSILICLLGVVIFFIVYSHVYVRGDDGWLIGGNSLIGAGAFFFLLGGMHLGFFEKRFWSFLALPGRLSYGIYLIHSTVLYFLWPYLGDKNEWVAFLIFAGAATALAWLSYRYYEVPANGWVRKITGRPPGQAQGT